MKRVLPIAAVSVVAATLGMIVRAPSFLTNGPAGMTRFPPVRALCHWDCWWYADIASTGYWFRPGEQSPVAFFPGFPLAVRAVSWLLGDVWLSGTVVSLGCDVAAVLLYSKWADAVAPAQSKTATLALAVYPLAVYLYGVVYSDGLFLLLVVGAFLALEKDRVVLATVLGACATASRPVAPAVVLGLLVVHLGRRRGQPKRAIDYLPVLASLGLLGWMLFLRVRFDDALAYLHVQSAPGWGQGFGLEQVFKFRFFEIVGTAPRHGFKLALSAFCGIATLALAGAVRRRLGWGYAVYLSFVIGLPLLVNKDFHEMWRFVLAAFPVWIPIAAFLDQRPRLRVAWLAASFAGLVYCAALFGSDYYLA